MQSIDIIDSYNYAFAISFARQNKKGFSFLKKGKSLKYVYFPLAADQFSAKDLAANCNHKLAAWDIERPRFQIMNIW